MLGSLQVTRPSWRKKTELIIWQKLVQNQMSGQVSWFIVSGPFGRFTWWSGMSSRDISSKSLVVVIPTKRPNGITNSLFLEIEYEISDRQLNAKYASRPHFSASFAKARNSSSATVSAFFQGNCLIESGIMFHNFCCVLFNMTTSLEGSLKCSIPGNFAKQDTEMCFFGTFIRKGLRSWCSWLLDDTSCATQNRCKSLNN